jgi:hypothetical protein
VNVQRLSERINDRDYLIEVARVSLDLWRANIVQRHGGPSALMPLYGPTPDEAARQLRTWLALAHRNAG